MPKCRQSFQKAAKFVVSKWRKSYFKIRLPKCYWRYQISRRMSLSRLRLVEEFGEIKFRILSKNSSNCSSVLRQWRGCCTLGCLTYWRRIEKNKKSKLRKRSHKFEFTAKTLFAQGKLRCLQKPYSPTLTHLLRLSWLSCRFKYHCRQNPTILPKNCQIIKKLSMQKSKVSAVSEIKKWTKSLTDQLKKRKQTKTKSTWNSIHFPQYSVWSQIEALGPRLKAVTWQVGVTRLWWSHALVTMLNRTSRCLRLSATAVSYRSASGGFKVNIANTNFLATVNPSLGPKCLSTLLILLGVLAQMTGEATSSAAAQAGRAAAAGHQATTNAAASGHHYQVRHVLPYFFLYSNHAEYNVILPDWTFKKWGHSNFAFQHC